jgi:hypothetical protein
MTTISVRGMLVNVWCKEEGEETYRTVQNVLVALTGNLQSNVGGITRGNIRLGHEESRANLAVEQRLEPLVLLSLGAVLCNDLHVSSVWSSTVGGLGGSAALAQVLGHEPVLQIAEASTLLEVVLGQEHVPQAKLFCTLLQVLDDGWVVAEALGCCFANLLGKDRVGRDAFFFDKLFDLLDVVISLVWSLPKL